MGCRVVQGIADQERIVIDVSESAYGHVAESVICRGISLLRDESPLEPFPVVALVERHPEIVQKIGHTASSRRGEGGFCNDSVAFSLCCAGIEQEGDYVPSFAEEPLAGFLSFGKSELHLGNVAGFMH